MRYISTLFLALLLANVSAQTSLTIPAIQGTGNSSSYSGVLVQTSGIVTAKYIGNNMVSGFFMQDEAGDGNTNTSDGIFVSTTTDNVTVGSKIQLTGTVNEYYGRTQLINPSNITVLSTNNTLPVTKVVFDPVNFSWEKYEGMLLEFNQTLYVNKNNNLQQNGELELGDIRKQSPTNFAFPASTEYTALVNRNALTPIYLDDARTSYTYPIVFADENGTRRTGERVKNLQAVVDYSNSKYLIYPAQFPVAFFGNPRKTAPDNLGKTNLKVCGFNLEYYLAQNLGTGFGPDNQSQSDNQHTKIIDALKAIDADIYGLVEIEQGQAALTKLVNGLNAATGSYRYAFINDGGTPSGSFTKVGYLYRSDRVTPYLSLKNNNSPSPVNRKKLQAFTLKENGEKFLFSINHFKAKSGCSSANGTDADQGDGQSCYNATRVEEANSTINFINSNKAYYGDEDALIMGDLNAYAKEDPIQTFVNAGYKDLHQVFHADSAYSYVYSGETGYLDHALATESLAKQITGVTAFHINADEPPMFEYSGSAYQPNMYRCSDHDPVIVGLSLGNSVNVDLLPFDQKVKIYPTVIDTYFNVENAENAYIQIFSLNGILIFEDQITSSPHEYNISKIGLAQGAYVVRVLGDSAIARRIIIVK